MAKGIISKGIKLSLGTVSGSTVTYKQLPNLVSIGDVGNDGIDTVEITDLESTSHEFMGGLATVPGSIEFVFNFDAGETTTESTVYGSSYDTLSALSATAKQDFKLEIPTIGNSTETITFQGFVACKVNGATYNEGLKFTANIVPYGAISL